MSAERSVRRANAGVSVTPARFAGRAIVVWLAIICACSRSALSAGVPYFENFDSYDNASNPAVVPAGFAASAGWSVKDDGAGNDYQHSATATHEGSFGTRTSYQASTLSLTNVAGTNFEMSAQVTIDYVYTSNASNNLEAGILCLGESTFLAGYKGAIDVANEGQGTLTLKRNGSSLGSALFPSTLTTGTVYYLTLRAVYGGPTNLSLTFSMSDGAATGSVACVDAAPLTGQRFGFEDVLTTVPGGTTASIIAHYDDLAVVPYAPPVPPPAVSISSIAVSDGVVTLGITNLTVGATNAVVRTSAWGLSEWATTSTFRASGSFTNWSAADADSNACFKVQSSR